MLSDYSDNILCLSIPNQLNFGFNVIIIFIKIKVVFKINEYMVSEIIHYVTVW